MPQSPILSLHNIVKKFGNFEAVAGIDLEIFEGEFLTIVGPSGSGKSTLIRLLVGMDEVTSGDILLRGQNINQTPANLRPTCMVFQSLALFPHMSVGQNIEFPLKLRNIDPVNRKSKAFELLDLLQLPKNHYEKRISQCSGGEKQRVALARALAFEPEILFFDEPLSALDYRLRRELEKELKSLHERTEKTFVYITHSLEEAMVMSDRIAIMNSGKFIQVAVADEIYSRPSTKFVAQFMGEVNLFDVFHSENGEVQCPNLELINKENSESLINKIPKNSKATLMVRPEDTRILNSGETADFKVKGRIIGEYTLGSRIQYQIELTNHDSITVEKLREDKFDGDQSNTVDVGFETNSVHIIWDEAK